MINIRHLRDWRFRTGAVLVAGAAILGLFLMLTVLGT